MAVNTQSSCLAVSAIRDLEGVIISLHLGAIQILPDVVP
jgi:hypothetical protein